MCVCVCMRACTSLLAPFLLVLAAQGPGSPPAVTTPVTPPVSVLHIKCIRTCVCVSVCLALLIAHTFYSIESLFICTYTVISSAASLLWLTWLYWLSLCWNMLLLCVCDVIFYFWITTHMYHLSREGQLQPTQ